MLYAKTLPVLARWPSITGHSSCNGRKGEVEIMTAASVGSAQVSRRAFLGGAMTVAGGALASSLLAPTPFARAEEPMTSPTAEAAATGIGPEWIATTQTAPWQTKGQASIATASGSK